ncbi:MAG: Acetyltransferase family [Fibrobacteria bacterium]|nr:Acetyltransferase family [Fibrobacteria bacterium]
MTTSFTLRPAIPADAAFLAECLIAIARSVRDRPGSAYNVRLPAVVTPREFEYALGFLQSPEKLPLIAQEDGRSERKVGCLLAEITESSVPALTAEKVGSIAALWVSPEFREKGIGKSLTAQAEEWFREKGVRFAELSYGADSETAGAAWTAQGYAPFRVFAVKDLEAGKR